MSVNLMHGTASLTAADLLLNFPTNYLRIDTLGPATGKVPLDER